jgi:hypothetical protein
MVLVLKEIPIKDNLIKVGAVKAWTIPQLDDVSTPEEAFDRLFKIKTNSWKIGYSRILVLASDQALMEFNTKEEGVVYMENQPATDRCDSDDEVFDMAEILKTDSGYKINLCYRSIAGETYDVARTIICERIMADV